MKIDYKFSNLIGTVYSQGNIQFTADGTTLLSPVGNRVSFFDLQKNRSETLPVESKFNISVVALSPKGNALILVNERGEALYVSLVSRTVLHRHRFNKPVRDVQFSPDGKKFAVCRDTDVQIFSAAGVSSGQYNPFQLLATYHVSHTAATCLAWSADSALLAAGCSDLKSVVVGARNYRNLFMYSLGGHTGPIAALFFLPDSLDLLTLDKRGFLVHWECAIDSADLRPCKAGQRYQGPTTVKDEHEDTEGSATDGEEVEIDEESMDDVKKISYSKLARHRFHDAMEGSGVKLTCAAFHAKSKLLVTGFSNGAFTLHEMPDFSLIHSLSISSQSVRGVAINSSGDWLGLACGSEGKGHLVVWEWASESFVLKEQGHAHDTAVVAFSPDGHFIATGGEDSKLKVWAAKSGFSVATFGEHSGGIRGVAWTQGGKAVLSASLDGSVRAFDMARLRNFKTLTSPAPVQFSCLAVDGSGEVVAAGAQDDFSVFLWSLQSGRLLDVLAGHEGPVSSVAFNGSHNQLLSTSWDKTLRVWEVFEGKGRNELIQLSAEGLCGRFSPDGQTVAALGLDSQIHMYDWKTGSEVGSIECALDLDSGRAEKDQITAKKSAKAKSFTTFAFSGDGSQILVGGQSAHVCLYSVPAQLLLKKFTITTNFSLDAVAEDLDPRRMSEFGPYGDGNSDSDDSTLGPSSRRPAKLAGVRSGDASARTHRPEIRVSGLEFSPTGRSWAGVSTEGLLLFSLDDAVLFDPFHLDTDITPKATRAAVDAGEPGTALLMALKLNEADLVREVVQQIPLPNVDGVVGHLPLIYAEKLLAWMAGKGALESTNHVHFYVRLLKCILRFHGPELKLRASENAATFTGLQQILTSRLEHLRKLADHNKYTLDYILCANAIADNAQHLSIGDSKS